MRPMRFSPSDPPAAKPASSTLESWRSTGLVMVVDDEPTVRDVAAELLEVMGLTPHACEDGESAIAFTNSFASAAGTSSCAFRRALAHAQPFSSSMRWT